MSFLHASAFTRLTQGGYLQKMTGLANSDKDVHVFSITIATNVQNINKLKICFIQIRCTTWQFLSFFAGKHVSQYCQFHNPFRMKMVVFTFMFVCFM